MSGYLPDGCTQRECDEAQPGYWDEAPQQWFVCDECDGSGEIVRGEWGCEPGCGRHMMEVGEPCGRCNGEGGWIDNVEADWSPT